MVVMRTKPLEDYSEDYQKIMERIDADLGKSGFEVKKLAGSYTVRNPERGQTVLKIACTELSPNMSMSNVIICFRKEIIDQLGLSEVSQQYPNLHLKPESVVSMGGGQYEDFYFINVPSRDEENYNKMIKETLILAGKIGGKTSSSSLDALNSIVF